MNSQRIVFSMILALFIYLGASVSPGATAFASGTGTLSMTWGSVGVVQNFGTRVIAVNRSGGSTGAASVRCTTVNNTAVAGQDFTAIDQVVSWTDGDLTAKNCNVTISNATPFTGEKTFYIRLSNASGAPLGAQTQTTVTIYGDKGGGLVSLSAPTYTVSQNAGSVTITVNRTGGAYGGAVVGYSTANGTATAGTNYTHVGGVLNWGNGDASPKAFSIPLSKATPFSGSKTIAVAIAHTEGASLGTPASAIVTINGSASSPPAASKPTVSLSANPTSVTSGSGSTLNWTSTNATSCTASGAWSGTQAVSGSYSTGALTSSATYTLTCTGTGGSASQSATVTVTASAPPPPPTGCPARARAVR